MSVLTLCMYCQWHGTSYALERDCLNMLEYSYDTSQACQTALCNVYKNVKSHFYFLLMVLDFLCVCLLQFHISSARIGNIVELQWLRHL